MPVRQRFASKPGLIGIKETKEENEALLEAEEELDGVEALAELLTDTLLVLLELFVELATLSLLLTEDDVLLDELLAELEFEPALDVVRSLVTLVLARLS